MDGPGCREKFPHLGLGADGDAQPARTLGESNHRVRMFRLPQLLKPIGCDEAGWPGKNEIGLAGQHLKAKRLERPRWFLVRNSTMRSNCFR